jgi:hypothetical protein
MPSGDLFVGQAAVWGLSAFLRAASGLHLVHAAAEAI